MLLFRVVTRTDEQPPETGTDRIRDNTAWLADLRATGVRRDTAILDLRSYVLRAILLYLTRQRSDLAGLDHEELRQLAEDWAQQAVLQIMKNLDGFHGRSRFTTWAYRVAINLAAGSLRRKAWRDLSLEHLTETESPRIHLREDRSEPAPEQAVERAELWETVQAIIRDELSERQRTALTRVVFEGAPVDVVAEQLETNANNVYKIMHDARKKLRSELEHRAWTAEAVMAAFETPVEELGAV